MKPEALKEAVCDRWGNACVICGRRPEEWLATNLGERRQDTLSFHHVNGDDTDDRVENIIPVCQSCHVHIHRVDEPPYRMWHRQLPIKHRNAWNEYHHEYYEGPRLTREETKRRFGDEQGVPESVKYLENEGQNFDPEDFETDATPGRDDNSGQDRSDDPETDCGDAGDCANHEDDDDADEAP